MVKRKARDGLEERRDPAGEQEQRKSGEQQNNETKLELQEFDNIRVVLNINAHVYKLPDSQLSYLGSRLVVLQLGRWWNLDDNTYIEVEGLEKLSAIGNLKNLRYLGICGLSKLIELPKEVNQLQQLEVLNVRGCQNLTHVMSYAIKTLRRLTHLDLTKCYMLEHIGQEITSCQSFKCSRGYQNKVCHPQDLGARMKNIRKLDTHIEAD
uniref:Disease resistance R13L4/SHOC-2-like LRR domain-containing protein n=1 Tax=Oryza punctata TaxID=4537 RepID=A0A0E0K0Y2_ORYPU